MKKNKSLVALLAFILIFVLSFSSFATDFTYNGTSNATSGNGRPTANASFSLRHLDYTDICAYRFSVLNESHNKTGKSVDVYYTSWDEYGKSYTGLYAVAGQNCKQDWAKGSTTLNDNYTVSSNGFTTKSGFDNMPRDPASLGSWLSRNSYQNTRIMFAACGVHNIPNGYHLIVEPVYMCTIQGRRSAFTLTELAVYGCGIYGANSNKGSASKNTFGYISHYVLRHFPNMLRDTSCDIFSGAPQLGSDTTYGNVIHGGYGVATVRASHVVKYGAVGIAMTNEAGNEIQIPNVIFEIKDDNNISYGKIKTDSRGYAWYGANSNDYHSGFTLDVNKRYWFKYVSGCPEGYEVSNTGWIPIYPKEGNTNWIYFPLKEAFGGIGICITDESGNELQIPDVVFQIKDNSGYLKSVSTDSRGYAWYGTDTDNYHSGFALPVGRQYWIKYSNYMAEGYTPVNSDWILITPIKGNTNWVYFKVAKAYGGIEFNAEYTTTHKKAPGLTYGIFTDEECKNRVATITTDQNGYANFGQENGKFVLPYEKVYYILYKSGAPNGYFPSPYKAGIRIPANKFSYCHISLSKDFTYKFYIPTYLEVTKKGGPKKEQHILMHSPYFQLPDEHAAVVSMDYSGKLKNKVDMAATADYSIYHSVDDRKLNYQCELTKVPWRAYPPGQVYPVAKIYAQLDDNEVRYAGNFTDTVTFSVSIQLAK